LHSEKIFPFRNAPNTKWWLFSFLLLLVINSSAIAQGLPAITSTPTPSGGQTYTVSIQTFLFFTALTFIPSVLLMMTSFTRIVIVLSLLRQALGTIQSPPNQVIIGLSLFLTFFIMAPTFDQIYREAYQPFSEEKITFQEALQRGSIPLKTFMLRQTRESDLSLFMKLSQEPAPKTPQDLSLKVVVPAFVISELKTAFQMGFMVFLPFLIIEMVVASVLMSMGMMMLSPVIISLPFKLMLFVLVDGWNLMVGSIVRSFV